MVADGSEAKMTEIMTFEANDDNTLQVRTIIIIIDY
jgi:hypothetical protein